ncbi:MAG: ROK family protein [Clostridia bacterium]|nr:ROK family protein [Clostridia bacterium]
MKYCIGIDLGGTNIAVGLVDLDSKRILDKRSVKTLAPRSADSIAQDMVKLITGLCERAGIKLWQVEWIGVATPGVVKDGVVISAPNLGWRNEPLGEIVYSLTGRPTFVANDANCAAYAEAIWGCGVGSQSLVAVTLGTGVGGGIIVDRKVWEGINGFAAEIGHMVIEANGRQCGCGKRGCLEAYCSASALVKESRRMMTLYPDSAMWQLAGGDINRVSGIHPFVAARAGDVAANQVVNDYVNYLAIGISNIINVFQPEVVCVGGGVSGEGDNLLLPLRERLKYTSFGTEASRTRVEIAKYRNDAGIIGAGLLGLMKEELQLKSVVELIVEKFEVEGAFVSAQPFGNGHINDTRLVKCKTPDGDLVEYVLQKINKSVFKNPPELMENYAKVTEFVREQIIEQGGDPEREVLHLIKSHEGKDYVVDNRGEYWRLLTYVTDSMSYDKVERPEQFYDSAVAFGNFQYMLRNYPADTLHETIKNFHNTPDRVRQLKDAIALDACGRLSEVEAEVKFALDREEFAKTLEIAHEEGRLPLRVTHNDTKLNNILFDTKTGKSLCVVDLDTIMPGYSVNDFGDSIRFGATTALEDEADLTKVNFDISLFELYTKGFIEGTKGGLTVSELELLPIGAMMMTYEVGIRFLADYLNGDVYFRTHRPGHNLDRARNQFKLLSDMEKALPEMQRIVAKYINK